MLKRLAFLFLVVALVLPSLACQLTERAIRIDTVRGSGQVVEETRPISGVEKVTLGGIGTAIVEIGDEQSLRIEAEDNLLPLIETDIEGDTLIIGIQEGINPQPTEPINYYLTVPSLEAVTVSGLGDVQLPELQSDEFEVVISGSGNIDAAALSADSLRVVISGLGDLNIDGGRVERQDVLISGGGSYRAQAMESNAAEVSITGLGSATLWAADRLDVRISGGGDVRYKGSPSIEENITGLGNIEPIEE